jgi:hypothetical protein
MLGSLPKILDKNFVIGFFLPALLAILAAAWAFPSFEILAPVRSLSASDKVGDLIYLVLLVFGLAIFLMTANDTQYRMLEGYLPPVSWILPFRWWHRLRFRWLQSKYDKKMKKWQTAVDNDEPFSAKQRAEIGGLLTKRQLYYPMSRDNPMSEDKIMRTRFGNIIRSFEEYPRETYGADSVYIWPRLASVVSKDFVALQDDARSQVDCYVNITHLALLIAIASLAGAAYDVRFILVSGWNDVTIDNIHNFLGDAGLRHLMFAGAGFAVAILAYWRACVNAIAWGHIVRSAFDCYLPALMKQLGFAMPAKASERKQFWREFSRLISHGTPMRTEWPIAETAKTGESAAKTGEGGAKTREVGARDGEQPPKDGSPAEETERQLATAPEASGMVTVNEVQAPIAAK